METNSDSIIAILGISDKTTRYSYRAYKQLLDSGYDNLIGITPKDIALPNISVVNSLQEINGSVHTLTLYVGAKRLDPLIDDILYLNPKRIICNPGTGNQDLIYKAQQKGIEVVEGCTLVMLNTDQF